MSNKTIEQTIKTVAKRVQKKLSATVPQSGCEEELDAIKAIRMKFLAHFETLRVALMEGRAHRVSDVETVLGEQVSNARSRLLAAPTSFAKRMLGHKDQAGVRELLKEMVGDALAQLKPYDAGLYNSRCRGFLLGLKDHGKEENDDE